MNAWAEWAWRWPGAGRRTGWRVWRKTAALLRQVGEAGGATAIKADFKEALRQLRLNKQRSLLALIGIVVGIGSVTAMVSIGLVAKAETVKRFAELGVDLLTVRVGAERRAVDPAWTGTSCPAREADAITAFWIVGSAGMGLPCWSFASTRRFSVGTTTRASAQVPSASSHRGDRIVCRVFAEIPLGAALGHPEAVINPRDSRLGPSFLGLGCSFAFAI